MNGSDATGSLPPETNWFSTATNVTHEIFLSPPWLPDRTQAFDPEPYADALARAGVQAVEFYCKDHNGLCYYRTAHGPSSKRDLVGPLIEALHARGIKFFAYVSAGYDAFALARHPDWRVVDREGRPRVVAPPLELVCFRSPYREYLLHQIKELVEGYPIDGLWLDIIPLAWPGPHTDSHLNDPDAESDFFMVHDVPLPCACSSCLEQFALEQDRPLPLEPTPDDQYDIFQFGVRGVSRLLHGARDLLRRARPDAIYTYNGSGCPGDPIDIGDIVSIEAHAPEYVFQSFAARWARGHGRSMEILTPGGLDGWMTPQAKPAALMQLEAAVAGVHGATAVVGRVIGSDGSWDQAHLDDLSAVYGAERSLADSRRESTSCPEVLVASTIHAASAPASWSPMAKGLEFWHAALLQGHIQYDIGNLERDLADYRLIVLPDQRAMSAAEVAIVERFVEDGGSCIVTGQTSLYWEDGSARADFALGKMLGVRYLGRSGVPFAYLTVREGALGGELAGRRLIIDREPLLFDPLDNETLAVANVPVFGPIDPYIIAWGYPEPTERRTQPLIVGHGTGRGSTTYVGVAFDEGPQRPGSPGRGFGGAWLRRLAITLTVSALGEPLLVTNAGAAVEVVLGRHRSGFTIDLLDHAVGWPDRLLPELGQGTVGDIRLRLDRDRLGLVSRARGVTGATVPTTVEGHWLDVAVPAFNVHARLFID
jgi:hypothetical protein